MKQILIIFLALILVACGAAPAGEQPAPTQVPPQPTQTPVIVVETVVEKPGNTREENIQANKDAAAWFRQIADEWDAARIEEYGE